MTLPVTYVEAEAIDTIAHWVDLVAQLLTTEAAHTVLRNHIRGLLRQGALQDRQPARDQHRGGESGVHREATEPRRRDDVHVAVAHPCYRSGKHGQPARQRRQ